MKASKSDGMVANIVHDSLKAVACRTPANGVKTGSDNRTIVFAGGSGVRAAVAEEAGSGNR